MRHKISLGLLTGLMSLSGCNGVDVGAPAPQAATPELPSEAPLAAQPNTASPGKTLAPIGVSYEILGKPAVGQPLEIRITTQSNVVVNALTTQVRGDEGLYVSPANVNFAVAQMRYEEPVMRTLTVTPLREGTHQLSIIVQGEIDGVLQANHVTIPIQVGDVQEQPKPMGTVTTDESGEAIISLPAEQN